MVSKNPVGTSPEAWQGPPPSGPGYASCGQRCPDCQKVVQVAGTWGDWDRIHGAICTADELPLTPGGPDAD